MARVVVTLLYVAEDAVVVATVVEMILVTMAVAPVVPLTNGVATTVVVLGAMPVADSSNIIHTIISVIVNTNCCKVVDESCVRALFRRLWF